jgi:hypothetical protein
LERFLQKNDGGKIVFGKKKTAAPTRPYTHRMHDAFGDDDRLTSTRFHIVRCALDDIRASIAELAYYREHLFIPNDLK